MPDALFRILTEGPTIMQKNYEKKIHTLQMENYALRQEVERLQLLLRKNRWERCKNFLKNL